MIKKMTFLSVLLLFTMSLFASFPVNTENVENQKINAETTSIALNGEEMDLGVNLEIAEADALSPAAGDSDEGFLITILLWFFLWPIAAHRWYKKKPAGWNILFIITFGGLGLWALIDLVQILTKSF